jgi:hypothetical protein
MKCLTICQPYAHLIVTPQAELPRFIFQKRVENRTWSTRYRGLLLIHAGLSKRWLNSFPHHFEALIYGAIVGVVALVDCVEVNSLGDPRRAEDAQRYPWLETHQHTEGPCAWVLNDARRFQRPIPYRGAQGLFDVPLKVVEEQLFWAGVNES